jgi:TRAP-type C4-dicarboxylate transport system permease large subunit
MKKTGNEYSYANYLLAAVSGVLLLLVIQTIFTSGLQIEMNFDRSRYKWWQFLMMFSPSGLTLTIPFALLIGVVSRTLRAPLFSSFLAILVAFFVGAFTTQATLFQSFQKACEREDCYMNDLSAGLVGLVTAAVAGIVVVIVWGIMGRIQQNRAQKN